MNSAAHQLRWEVERLVSDWNACQARCFSAPFIAQGHRACHRGFRGTSGNVHRGKRARCTGNLLLDGNPRRDKLVDNEFADPSARGDVPQGDMRKRFATDTVLTPMGIATPFLRHMREHLGFFRCPACAGELRLEEAVSCSSCAHRFPVQEGIPLLFVPNEWDGRSDVTERMKAFYEETPFPNYDNIDNTGTLIDKAERGLFARMLDRQTPVNTRILEVGCGTGQLSNYLGIARRTVFGADLCLNSLKLANGFRARNNLERIGFYQINLFRPPFKEASFELVICNGVLHHTSDPQAGFRSIAKPVKRGGHILIGLYNTYGRLITDARRKIFSLFNNRFTSLDPYLRRGDVDTVKRHTWFMDQYKNPHESKHTMGEVMEWFKAANFEFLSGVPSPTLEPYDENFRLFARHEKGSRLSRGLAQMNLVFTGSAEGGFFILIGKRG